MKTTAMSDDNQNERDDSESDSLPQGTYTCDMCKGVFGFGRTHEEDAAEYLETFGHAIPETDKVYLCDPCYQKVQPKQHPGALKAYLERYASRNN